MSFLRFFPFPVSLLFVSLLFLPFFSCFLLSFFTFYLGSSDNDVSKENKASVRIPSNLSLKV